jgi:cyclic pyranopterin phosphate synthase
MTAPLTHFDDSGASRMVDVSEKPVTVRTAIAEGRVTMRRETLDLIRNKQLAKGDVLEVARLAGIMGTKRTSDLIPLCHPLSLDGVTIDFETDHTAILIRAEVRTTARTGVEMEALTAVTVAALTIYDMCKSADRDITLGPFQLTEKTGGRSGTYRRS